MTDRAALPDLPEEYSALGHVYFFPDGGYFLLTRSSDPHKRGKKRKPEQAIREIAIGHELYQAIEKNKTSRWSSITQDGLALKLSTKYNLSDRSMWEFHGYYKQMHDAGRIFNNPSWFLHPPEK